MHEHSHVCHSKYHEGRRARTHYADTCTEPKNLTCIPCHDDELAAAGATWQYHDDSSFSDADPGL